VEFASTAAYFHSAKLLSRIAAVLGKPDDARAYADLARRIGDRLNQRFFDGATGLYGPDTQTAPAMALQLGFAPADKRALVLDGLVKNIQRRGGHLSTGIVGTFYLPYALGDNGRADLALKVLTAEGYPGYVQMIRSGASTVWEQWDGINSLNHPALGCVGAWFYQALAGIRPDPDQSGFKRIVLQPQPAGLTWARASYRSIRGRIVSDWRIGGGVFTWNIVVPANTRALVYVPVGESGAVRESGKDASRAAGVKYLGRRDGATIYELGSGRYCFTAPTITACHEVNK
jgi:alpha-L-rhamnosidase